jgi:hypothetical protein
MWKNAGGNRAHIGYLPCVFTTHSAERERGKTLALFSLESFLIAG